MAGEIVQAMDRATPWVHVNLKRVDSMCTWAKHYQTRVRPNVANAQINGSLNSTRSKKEFIKIMISPSKNPAKFYKKKSKCYSVANAHHHTMIFMYFIYVCVCVSIIATNMRW